MLVVALFALTATTESGNGSSPPATFTNPVWDRDCPDPFVLAYGGRFYAYATETAAVGRGFQVLESTDLVRWTHRGLAYRPPWSDVHYWAPEVVRHRGRFHMTYSARNPATGKHDIGIATAASPVGPFTHRAILVRGDDNRVGVIDATIFFDRDRTPYLIYSEEDPRSIVLRRLAPDLDRVVGPRVVLLRPDREIERGIVEAPTMVLRRGVYHLFYSSGWFQSYKADACYAVYSATSRSLTGPFTKDTRPLIQTVPGAVYGPGHQSIVSLPGGEYWMVYHGWDARGEPLYGRNPAGRTLRIDRMVWIGDVPVADGPTTSPRPAPRARR
ncbi:MAG TPA: glycoside hydrolase family 43 protein [Chthonomonadales bacterium]|nr:glycoside hydrolase family 43 protein [Chthonomonadales bacterium]